MPWVVRTCTILYILYLVNSVAFWNRIADNSCRISHSISSSCFPRKAPEVSRCVRGLGRICQSADHVYVQSIWCPRWRSRHMSPHASEIFSSFRAKSSPARCILPSQVSLKRKYMSGLLAPNPLPFPSSGEQLLSQIWPPMKLP